MDVNWAVCEELRGSWALFTKLQSEKVNISELVNMYPYYYYMFLMNFILMYSEYVLCILIQSEAKKGDNCEII